MLRVFTAERDDTTATIKLEGWIVGEWVPVLERECERARSSGLQLRLDLEDVSFVDGRGVELLRRFQDGSTTLSNPSPYVSALLRASGDERAQSGNGHAQGGNGHTQNRNGGGR